MKSYLERHIELVELVNNAKTVKQHEEARTYLNGFREAGKLLIDDIGLMACDMHYINQGIDRPMCAGVFIDWETANDN